MLLPDRYTAVRLAPSNASDSEGAGPHTATGSSKPTVTLSLAPCAGMPPPGDSETFATNAGDSLISCTP